MHKDGQIRIRLQEQNLIWNSWSLIPSPNFSTQDRDNCFHVYLAISSNNETGTSNLRSWKIHIYFIRYNKRLITTNTRTVHSSACFFCFWNRGLRRALTFRVWISPTFCLPRWIRPCFVPKTSSLVFLRIFCLSCFGCFMAFFIRFSLANLSRLREKSALGPTSTNSTLGTVLSDFLRTDLNKTCFTCAVNVSCL